MVKRYIRNVLNHVYYKLYYYSGCLVGAYKILYHKFYNKKDRNDILLELKNINTYAGGRYFYLLPRLLVEAGYYLCIKTKLDWIARPGEYGKMALDIEEVSFKFFGPKEKYNIIITDSEESEESYLPYCEKLINLRYDWFSSNDREKKFPFFMDPRQYFEGYKNKIIKLRKKDKKIGLLFSGKCGEDMYSGGSIEDKFGLISRKKIIDRAERYIRNKNLELKKNRNEVEEILMDGDIRVSSREKAIVMRGRKIPSEDWLNVLSAADFFLAAPGRTQPLCHNIVESLAVGTIPITNYGHLLNKSLTEDMALLFSGLKELENCIIRALKMNIDERKKMSKRAIEYYESNMSPYSLRKRIDNLETRDCVYMNIETTK